MFLLEDFFNDFFLPDVDGALRVSGDDLTGSSDREARGRHFAADESLLSHSGI